MKRRWIGVGVALALLTSTTGYLVERARAGVACSLPFNLQNNTTGDATQVMANYNALVTCLGNAAAAGANSDITSILGLTTPLSPTQGGSSVFIGGTSTGSANAYVIAAPAPIGFSLTAGYTIIFTPNFTNNGPATLAVNGLTATNLYKQTTAGPSPLVNGEVQNGQIVVAVYDGVQFEFNPAISVNTGWGIANISTIAAASVVTGGSGCTNGTQTFTVSGGTGVAATFTGTVTSNALAGALTIVSAGAYTSVPSSPATVTGGGCSVAPTVTLTSSAPSVSISYAGPPLSGNAACSNVALSTSNNGTVLTINALAADIAATPTSVHPILCPFRSATLGNGTPSWVPITSALTINTNAAGATLGCQNSVPCRFWLVAFYNAGTPVLALFNASTTGTIFPLNTSQLQSTTGISSGATSAGVFYTPNGVALSSQPFTILGYLETTETTAGTYASAPSLIQIFGPGTKKPGDIVQAVYGTNSTQSITPTSNCNLVRAHMEVNLNLTASSTIQFRRVSTNIGNAQAIGGSALTMSATAAITALDNPATTSSTSYNSTITTGSGASYTNELEEIQG